MAGRLRVKAGRLVNTGKTRKQEQSTGADGKVLVDLMKQNELATDTQRKQA
jgi:hypothetical protein